MSFFSCATIPGQRDGANEDWVAGSPDLAVVLDGGTARTATGCRHTVSWYAHRLGARVMANAFDRRHSLAQALSTAIADVAAMHQECDLAHPGTPSAAVGIVRVDGGALRYLVLGDVTVAVETTERTKVITDDRISRTAPRERATADRYPIGDMRKAPALEAMKQAELRARNTPGGYYIAAADPAAADQALCGSISLAGFRRGALLTDGAARAVTLFGLHTWETLLGTLEYEGPVELLRAVRRAEDSDPAGEAFPRNKRKDDASVVLFTSPRSYRRTSRVVHDPAGLAAAARERSAAPTLKGVNRPDAAPAFAGCQNG